MYRRCVTTCCEISCSLSYVSDVLLCTASIWGLLVIAVDRYSATFYPLWYRTKYPVHRIVIYIAVVWVASTLTSIPPLFGFGSLLTNSYKGKSTPPTCSLYVTIDFAMYSSAMTFIVPTIVMIVLYGRIYIEIRRRSADFAHFTFW